MQHTGIDMSFACVGDYLTKSNNYSFKIKQITEKTYMGNLVYLTKEASTYEGEIKRLYYKNGKTVEEGPNMFNVVAIIKPAVSIRLE
jgi:hypothetical protein